MERAGIVYNSGQLPVVISFCMISVCEEAPEDIAAVRRVNEVAFGGPTEAGIVDALRANCDDILSLVAVDDEEIIGHIVISPATVESGQRVASGTALGPMAVLPEDQRRGIGSQLVETGIARLRQQSCPFIIVLGHAEYYPRFGFVPASSCGVATWGRSSGAPPRRRSGAWQLRDRGIAI